MKRIVAVTLAFLLAVVGVANAQTANSIITAQTPQRGLVQFLQGTDSAGTYKTMFTAGTNGSKCFAMWSTNNDASATHLLTVQIVNTSVKYGGMSITSVVNAGFANAVPAQNLMAAANWPGLPLDGNGNPYILLLSGDTIQMTFATALTASDVINGYVQCVNF